MGIKFYSEELDQLFDTMEDLDAAVYAKKEKELAAERAAAEKEAAKQKVDLAYENYIQLARDYAETYGSYAYSNYVSEGYEKAIDELLKSLKKEKPVTLLNGKTAKISDNVKEKLPSPSDIEKFLEELFK